MFFATTFSSCLEDDEPSLVENSVDQNNKDEIERLENQVSALKWELSRISLKIRTVNGRQLVRDKKTNLKHLKFLNSFWKKVGSKTVIMNVEKHDKIFSITSHLPHLVAYNLVKSAQDFEKKQ